MFASFKKLFRKDTGEDLATSIPEVPTAVSAAPSAGIASKPMTMPFPSQPRSQMAAVPAPATSPDVVALSLKSVLARLPNSLSSVVQSQGNGFISLPAQRIKNELPKGAVKLPFGELRQAAPEGTFFENARHDQVLIELPLDEILLRLHSSVLSRRQDQKQIVVPADIADIFGPRGEGVTLSAPAPTAPKMAKPAAPDASMPSAFSQPSRTTAPAPAIVPAPANASADLPLRVLQTQPQAAPVGSTIKVPLAALSQSWPAKVSQELSGLNTASMFIAFPIVQLEHGLKTGKLVFPWGQICEWIQPPVSNSAVGEETAVELPLSVIAPLFMAQHKSKVQKKIYIGDLPDLFAAQTDTVPDTSITSLPEPVAPPITIKMAAPAEPLAASIPKAPTTPVAPIAPVVPVAFVAPANPIAPTTPIAPATPVAPAAPVIAPVAEAVPTVVPEQTFNTVGEIFGQPAKLNWSPNEIVKHLAALPDVAGAFVAMNDGLLVAADLPSHLKAETVAAFLPQIFGRMNQYAKELQLGGLTSFSFVAESVQWQIIKSKTVYLVAIGNSGETLPGSKLNVIATELGQQIQ